MTEIRETNYVRPQILGSINLDEKTKQSFIKESGVMFDGEINISTLEEAFKPIREETVQNSDGTTSKVATYATGLTITTTMRKDAQGKEYKEQINKDSKGNIIMTCKTYPGEKSECLIFNKDGSLECSINTIYDSDGKTLKIPHSDKTTAKPEQSEISVPSSKAAKAPSKLSNKDTQAAGYVPKVGATSRYHKGFIIEKISNGLIFERDKNNPNRLLICNKNGEIIHSVTTKEHSKIEKVITYKDKKPVSTMIQRGEDVVVIDHTKGTQEVTRNSAISLGYQL